MDARIFMQTIIALASASLGLVAALAWNEAIRATIRKIASDDSLAGLYIYAVLATLTAIVVVTWLGWVAAKMGGEAKITREAEG